MTDDSAVLDVSGFNSSILATIPCGIIVIDVTGKVLYANKGVEEIFGVSAVSLVGKPLLLDTSFRLLVSLISEHRKSVPPLAISRKEVEQEYVRADGTRIPLSFSVASLVDDKRTMHGYVVICRNVTSIKLLEDRAKRAEAMAGLGTIAAGVAHEIRNPLHAIRGATELLSLKMQTDPDVARYLEVIGGEVERADRIIREILDYSKPARLELAPCNVNATIRRHIDRIDPDPSVRVVFDLMSGLPMISVDKAKLGQVLDNLFNNAIESMAGQGELRIVTSLDPGPPQHSTPTVRTGYIRIDVSDTGPGVPSADLPHIFDLFYSSPKKERGIGLGLAICRKIIEAHRGFLRVHSVPGQGATFSVFLPAS